MKKIKLARGELTLVDDSFYEILSKYKWYKNSKGYVKRTLYSDSKPVTVYMARIIMQAKKGQEVDHINQNKLDNRKKNLRICTHEQNVKNQWLRNKKKLYSEYKGVYWYKTRNLYQVSISINNKLTTLGYFKNPKEGALIYDKYCIKYHGKFAKLNFPKKAIPSLC